MRWLDRHPVKLGAALLLLVAVICLIFSGSPSTQHAAVGPVKGTAPTTTLHYASTGNFSGSTYLPGPYGYNLADVSSNSATAALPSGVKGLEYMGDTQGGCAGSGSSTFTSFIQSFAPGSVPDPNVWGFYLEDEPTPGTGTTNSSCAAANLKSEADYIHGLGYGWKAFLVEQNLNSFASPNYYNGFGPSNTDIDYFGLDPYPCRSEFAGPNPCHYSGIAANVAQAESTATGTNFYGQTGPNPGIPVADIVPVYQTFGGGSWVDDTGGSYVLPTADQLTRILAMWSSLVPTPIFDYSYTWGSQLSDTALGTQPALQAVMLAHNTASGSPPTAPTSETFTNAPSGNCVLNWGAPSSNGGTSVTGYSLLSQDSNGGTVTSTVAAPGTTFGGSSGETFTAQVAAITNSGNTTGPYASLLTCTQT